jgi:CheY-like chemotaxis protein
MKPINLNYESDLKMDRRKTILILEDSPDWMLLYLTTADALNCSAHGAANGIEGVARLKSIPKPDLILLDLEMPEMSGLAFYTELQKIEDYRAIKIILTSENPLARDLAKALKLYGHVPKSAPIFELQQLMRSALA